MDKITDRRVRKTKAALRGALVKLMEKKSIQEISVKELCEKCDINRSTFYLHYTDVYNLLQMIEKEMLLELNAVLEDFELPKNKPQASPSPIMCKIFKFLASNADMCRVLLCNNGDMAFVEEVKGIVRIKFMSEWQSRINSSANEQTEYVYTFIISGCIGILQEWLRRGMPKSADEMAQIVEKILVSGVASLSF
ncbi:MAG: TetR-like C-terminal domain-containing protein [Oscillospiraceae bacterium]